TAGDGCSDFCQIELLYSCTGTPSACTLRHLEINEVDYDQVGTDGAEYLEIYNPSDTDVPLDDYTVVLINGSGSVAYDMYNLIDAGGPLGAPQYLVVGTAATVIPTLPAGTLSIALTGAIQNGSPDGVALVNNTSGTLVDALSYEGAITAATVPGITGTVTLVEGTMLAAGV